MVSQRIEQLLKRELARLSEPQQERVIEFARSLPSNLPKGMTGAEFLEIAAKIREVIPAEDLDVIAKIIDREFNDIDPDGW